MSVTFSSNCGSLETLNLAVRCGLRPASRQMRCTLVRLMPIAFAIARTLQCVASGGVSRAVFANNLAFVAAARGFLPGGRVLSRRSPSTPYSAKRFCHRQTHGFDMPVARQIAFTLSPSAVASTIRDRHTTFAGELRSAIKPASRTRSSVVTVISAFMPRACMICRGRGIHRQGRNTSSNSSAH